MSEGIGTAVIRAGHQTGVSPSTRLLGTVAAALILVVGAAVVPAEAAGPVGPAPTEEPYSTLCSEVGSPVGGVCELWVSRYDAPGGSWDFGIDVASAPDGARVFVTGQSGGGPYSRDGDYATVAYDTSTGARLWVSRYDGPGGAGPLFGSGDGMDDAKAITVSPDGELVYVTGTSWGGQATNMDHATIAYDAATGEERWVARYDGTGAIDLAVSEDGLHLFVTGGAFSNPSVKADYGTVAYDARTGEELWIAEYNNDAANREDVASSIAASPDGSRVYVTGWSLPETGFGRSYTTIAYDAETGQELWITSYSGGNAEPTSIVVSPDGSSLYVTGSAGSALGTVAYDSATGDQRWDARFHSDPFEINYANALSISPDGSRIFVAGSSESDDSNRSDFITLAYDSLSGEETWVRRYDGHCGNSDEAYDIAVAPAGHEVYVTGRSWSHGDCSIQDLERTINAVDYTTIAYDAVTGNQQWLSRYDGGGGWDTALGAAVAPTGDRLFVTGWSTGGRGLNDYATVAYQIGELGPTPSPPPATSPPSEPTDPPFHRGSYPGAPDDDFFADQWGTQTIQASAAWQLPRATGAGIRVAVVDTGVDLDHEDLQCPAKLEVFPGSDVVKDGAGPDDFDGHGTHVAGVIAACTNNATGIAGVAPDAVVMPVQVFDPDGSTFEEVAKGIRRATDAGAHVINLSLGPEIGPISYVPGLFDDVEESIAHARSRGVVLVAAAGNDSMPLCHYPALSPHVICVGASDSRDLKAWYSTFPMKPDGDLLAVVAPGGTETVAFCNIPEETILSLWPQVLDNCNEGRSGYQDMAGTSMATPHVAGIAVLAYDRLGGTRSPENAQTIVDAIVDNADDLGPPGYDPVFGFGRVNALATVDALEVAEPDPSLSPTASTSPTASSSPSASPVPEGSELSFTERSESAGQYSDFTLFEARLTSGDGSPIAGTAVSFELTGEDSSRSFTATTDDDGLASVSPVLVERPGSYHLTARFEGGEDYGSSADTTSFVVDKEDTDLDLTVEGKGNKRTLRAGLSDRDAPSGGVVGRTIDFYADGELIGSATTDDDGVATLEPPARYRGGKHEFDARFDGDDYYVTSSDQRPTG